MGQPGWSREWRCTSNSFLAVFFPLTFAKTIQYPVNVSCLWYATPEMHSELLFLACEQVASFHAARKRTRGDDTDYVIYIDLRGLLSQSKHTVAARKDQYA